MKLRAHLACVVLVAVACFIQGCGGDGSTDVTGVWSGGALIPAGAPVPKGGITNPPSNVWIFHTNGSIVTARNGYTTYIGYQDGGEIHLVDTQDADNYVDLTVNGGTMSGTMSGALGGTLVTAEAFDVVMPTETPIELEKVGETSELLTVSGNIGQLDLQLDSVNSFASRMVGFDEERTIYHFADGRYFAISLGCGSDLAVGSYPLVESRPAPGQAALTITNNENGSTTARPATAGTLVITAISDDRIAGSFHVDSFQSETGTATGSFDVQTGYTSELHLIGDDFDRF